MISKTEFTPTFNWEKADKIGDICGLTKYDFWDKPTYNPFNGKQITDFPLDIFPDWLSGAVRASADTMRLKTSPSALLALSSIACALAGKVEIKAGSHIEPLALYSVIVAESSTGKTQTVNMMMKPLVDWDSHIALKYRDKIKNDRATNALYDVEIQKLKKPSLKDKRSIEERAKLICEYEDKKSKLMVDKPKIWVGNITQEKLIEYLARPHSGEYMSIVHDELSGLLNNVHGLYNSGRANMDLFLSAYSRAMYSYSRKGSQVEDALKKPTLNIISGIQPDILKGYLEAAGGELGLFGRFIYAILEYKDTYELTEDQRQKLLVSYYAKMEELYNVMSNQKEQIVLSLDANAKKVFEDYWEQYFLKLRSKHGELVNNTQLRYWVGKLRGSVLRIAGLLHVAENSMDLYHTEVDEFTINNAIDIAEHFKIQASLIFQASESSKSDNQFISIWKKFVEKAEENFLACKGCQVLLSDIQQSCGGAQRRILNDSVERMIERNWICKLEGVKAETYIVNMPFARYWMQSR